MRVVLASIHPQTLSGQIAGLQGLAAGLRGLGAEVALVSAGRKTTPTPGGPPAQRKSSSLPSQASAMAQTLRQLSREVVGADVVHINLPTPAFGVVSEALQAMVRVPVVVGFEAHLSDMGWLLRHGLARDVRFYLPRLLVNNSLLAHWPTHRCAAYVVSSRVGAVELSHLGFPGSSVHVLSNVVETEDHPPLTREEARRELGLPDGPIVTYIGHYHHVKGVETLVSAFSRVAQEHQGARLVLAWSGLGRTEPVDRAIRSHGLDERVIRLGCVRPSALYRAADVLALPYLSATAQALFPAVVLEALCVGVPLVTSDLADLRELLHEGRAARLVRPGDAAQLAGAISAVLADPLEREAMVRAQAALVRRDRNPQVVVKSYMDLYRSVAAGAQGRVLSERSATLADPAFGDVEAMTTAGAPERPANADNGGLRWRL